MLEGLRERGEGLYGGAGIGIVAAGGDPEFCGRRRQESACCQKERTEEQFEQAHRTGRECDERNFGWQ